MRDFRWMDALKGMAIIGVVFDHWVPFWDPTAPYPLNAMLRAIPWGAPVQLFFLLSGFGLMAGYLKNQSDWRWGTWIWRRLTKIIVPYWAAVAFSMGLGVLGASLYSSIDLHFSWESLIGLLTLTRSFFPESWAWNVALWYMPVIVGLYFCFPPLAIVLKGKRPWPIFIGSALLTYGSIAAFAVLRGGYRGHSQVCFPFFLVQFSAGMILALVWTKNPPQLRWALGFGGLSLGIGLCVASWGLKTYFVNGDAYNDLLTSIGIFLIFTNMVRATRSKIPVVLKAFRALGKQSYLIFLIHYPVMAFLLGPPFRKSMPSALIPGIGLAFIFGIYLLCLLISKPMGKITSWLYRHPPVFNGLGKIASPSASQRG